MKTAKKTAGRPRDAEIDKRMTTAFEQLVSEMPVREFGVQKLVSRAGATRDAFC